MTDTKLTLKNLEILRAHLATKDWDKCTLTMNKFGGIEHLHLKEGVHNCGTSACMVGYAPEVIPVKPNDFIRYSLEDVRELSFCYEQYSRRIFPVLERIPIRHLPIEFVNKMLSIKCKVQHLHRITIHTSLWAVIFEGFHSDFIKDGLDRMDLVIEYLKTII